jgi:hypothetical protein
MIATDVITEDSELQASQPQKRSRDLDEEHCFPNKKATHNRLNVSGRELTS